MIGTGGCWEGVGESRAALEPRRALFQRGCRRADFSYHSRLAHRAVPSWQRPRNGHWSHTACPRRLVRTAPCDSRRSCSAGMCAHWICGVCSQGPRSAWPPRRFPCRRARPMLRPPCVLACVTGTAPQHAYRGLATATPRRRRSSRLHSSSQWSQDAM